MSGVPPRRIFLPADREAWRQTRDARRILLDKVRARRRLMAARRSPRNNAGE
jgi:hypothetical protein